MELGQFQFNFTTRRVFILQDEKNSNINKEVIKKNSVKRIELSNRKFLRRKE